MVASALVPQWRSKIAGEKVGNWAAELLTRERAIGGK